MSGSTRADPSAAEMLRLFVAVDLNDAMRAQLAVAREAISVVLGSARVPPRVTWVKDESTHLTVRFIGPVDRERVPRIQDALASITFPPFDVRWGAVGTAGGLRHPRVIWVAPSEGVESLRAVAAQVNARLDPLLGRGETRPFAPHVTLGRVRESGQADWARALAAGQISPTVSPVDHVTLYQSRLSSQGPTYTALSTHG